MAQTFPCSGTGQVNQMAPSASGNQRELQSSRKYSLPDYYTNVTPASLLTNNQSFSPLMFFLQRMITFWNLPLRMNMSGLKKHGSNEVKLSAWRIQFHGLPTMGTNKLRIEHPQSMPSYPCFQMTPSQLEDSTFHGYCQRSCQISEPRTSSSSSPRPTTICHRETHTVELARGLWRRRSLLFFLEDSISKWPFCQQ